jgi:hypothetical protein
MFTFDVGPDYQAQQPEAPFTEISRLVMSDAAKWATASDWARRRGAL